MARKTPRNLDRPPKPQFLSWKQYWHLYRHEPARLAQLAEYPRTTSTRPAVLVSAEAGRTERN